MWQAMSNCSFWRSGVKWDVIPPPAGDRPAGGSPTADSDKPNTQDGTMHGFCSSRLRDPRLHDIVDDNPLEVVATGFVFLEGPVWRPTDHDRSDYAGDIPASRMYIVHGTESTLIAIRVTTPTGTPGIDPGAS